VHRRLSGLKRAQGTRVVHWPRRREFNARHRRGLRGQERGGARRGPRSGCSHETTAARGSGGRGRRQRSDSSVVRDDCDALTLALLFAPALDDGDDVGDEHAYEAEGNYGDNDEKDALNAGCSAGAVPAKLESLHRCHCWK